VHVIGENTDYRLGVDVTIAGQIWTIVNDNITPGVYQLLSEKGQASGYVPLEAYSKINPIYIDNIYTNNSYVVASIVERDALNTLTGDIVITTDTGQIWVKLNNDPAPTDNTDYAELQFPGSVISVNGQTGVVSITIANLLAISQNATDLNTFISTSTSVTALNGITSNHEIRITALEAAVDALEAALTGPALIPDYVSATSYVLNQAVKFQESSGRYNLYVANANIGPGNTPGTVPEWLRLGDYYTTSELDGFLLLKADLVGGVIPLNQLPGESLVMTYVVDTLAQRNAITPQIAGMRVYVTGNGSAYIYAPGNALADPQGFVQEADLVGSGGGSWIEITTAVEIVGGTNYLANSPTQLQLTVGTNYSNQTVRIVGKGSGGWKLTCTAPVVIKILDEVITGSIEAGAGQELAAIELINLDTNIWQVISAVGNLEFTNI